MTLRIHASTATPSSKSFPYDNGPSRNLRATFVLRNPFEPGQKQTRIGEYSGWFRKFGAILVLLCQLLKSSFNTPPSAEKNSKIKLIFNKLTQEIARDRNWVSQFLAQYIFSRKSVPISFTTPLLACSKTTQLSGTQTAQYLRNEQFSKQFHHKYLSTFHNLIQNPDFKA